MVSLWCWWQVKLLLLALLLYSLPICSSSVADSSKRGLLIIPGLGRVDRLLTVTHNLYLLEPYLSAPNDAASSTSHEHGRWDCIVYIYAPRPFLYSTTSSSSPSNTDKDSTIFWSKDHEAQRKYIETMCHIIEIPGALVTENLWMVQPAWVSQVYENIMILLDDVELVSNNRTNSRSSSSHASWELDHMLDIMNYHKLSFASTRVLGNTFAKGQEWRQVMTSSPPMTLTSSNKVAIGVISSFVEIYSCIYKRQAWEALWQLLHPSTNPYSWGYDFWYPAYAKQYLSKHFYTNGNRKAEMLLQYNGHKLHDHSGDIGLQYKQAVISSIITSHKQGDVRADASSESKKWSSVQMQEKYYSKYKNIPLKRYRRDFVLANKTATGAILDILDDLPDDWSSMSSNNKNNIVEISPHVGHNYKKKHHQMNAISDPHVGSARDTSDTINGMVGLVVINNVMVSSTHISAHSYNSQSILLFSLR